MRTFSKALLLAIGLVACGEDPVLEAAREEAAKGDAEPATRPQGDPGDPSPGEPGDPPRGEPGEGNPDKGVPEEPEPGDPTVPPPGGEIGVPDGSIPPPEGVETVLLKGKVEVEDYVRGAITIDVFDGDNSRRGGKRPEIVGRVKLDAPGPFELEVQKDITVWLSAYADQDENNRPSEEDPIGDCSCNPLRTGKNQNGLVVELTRGHPPKD